MSDDNSSSANLVAGKRGANYTEDEDVAIARAYMNVTTDPNTGAEQKAAVFYECIWRGYGERKPKDCPMRTITSVELRCKIIMKDCTRFSACYNSVRGVKKSGISSEDELRLSTALFNGKKVSHPRENDGKPFQFMRAWMVVRDLPKFDHPINAAKLNSNGTASGQSSVDGTVPAPRHRLRLVTTEKTRACR